MQAILNAIEGLLVARGARSLTAGEIHGLDPASDARGALENALRDAGYPDAFRNPYALGMTLGVLSRTRSGSRWLARTSAGRWFVGYGTQNDAGRRKAARLVRTRAAV